MTPIRIAHIPFVTHPDVVPDDQVAATVAFAAARGCAHNVTTFAVDICNASTPFSALVPTIAKMIRATGENS